MTSLPLGFLAAAQACGIKSDSTKLDLALFVSDRPCAAAGVFTTNRVVGAPVKVCRSRLPRETTRGVVINSGCANACTGEQGLKDAQWMTATVAQALSASPLGLNCLPEDILVCSTGVIGRFLPLEKLAAGIPKAALGLRSEPEAFLAAARAMMTTDTVPKQATRTVQIDGREVTLSGVCKGAAMIAPNMATMLCVMMTDLRLTPQETQSALKLSVDRSFNCISVDEHMSTSDTVLLLANGAAEVSLHHAHDRTAFQTALNEVAEELAQKIIRDAEGGSHFVTIDVTGCRNEQEAWKIAKTVADSPLVKTAIAGNDPNWGRIVSAAGYAGIPFEEEDCSLSINQLEVYHQGTPTPLPPAQVSASMKRGEVHIELEFTLGQSSARFWTSDLTTEYVRLNSEYTT